MNSRDLSRAAAASMLVLLTGAPAAKAQAADDERDLLPTVTVTATRRSELLTEVPQSIQAISDEKLRREGVVSMSDIVQVVPGASQTFKASPGFEVLQVRGVSSGAVGDSLVGYYIDEIPFSLPNLQYIPPVNVFDLSRVEVLRGPQGTLYGQSTMGGAIRLITNKPDLDGFAAEVRAGYGSVQGGSDGYRGDLMLNMPFSDKFGIRLTGGTSDEDSFIANTGKIKNDNVRLKALYQASDATSVEATAWKVQSDQADYSYGSPANPYRGITDPKEPRGVKTDVTIGNLTINSATGIGDFVSSTSYMDHQLDYVFALPGLRDLFPGAGQWLSTNAVDTRSLSQEFRLSSTTAGGLKWIGGAFYQDAKLETAQKQGWANYAAFGLGPNVYTAGTGELTSRSLGVFGELSTEWMDGRLVPTVGLRYYNDKREASDLRDGVRSKADRSFSSVNPRFNLAYKPADGTLYYLNIAKGFRSGALQSTAAVAAATAAGLPASAIMPQDSLWSYEVGGKWNTDRRVAVEVAVYAIDWKDAQITNLLVGAGGVTTTIISGGNDVRGYGIDFGLTWATPVRGLSAQFATNRNNLEFKKVPRNTIARVDQQIPGSPKQSATLALDYRRPVGALEFSTNVSFNYRGAQNEMTTAKESDSIRDWRLRIGVGSEKWDVSVYGLNLNDQRGVSAILSAAVVNPIQPRKVGIDANFRF